MADFEIHRILAQTRPTDTAAHTAYTKPSKQPVTVEAIAVCNTTASAATFRIFICTNGTTYDQTTAIAYDMTCPANDTDIISFPFTLDTAGGTVGVRSGTGSALNFTIIGKIKEFT